MKVGKPKSKRVPVRLRHKIQKSSANKQRKERKDAKKNPQWRSRLKKDPGIPNLFPYKDKVLAEIEESKRKKEEEKQRRIAVAKAQREGRKVEAADEAIEVGNEELPDAEGDDVEQEDGIDADEMEEDTNPMAALLASAQARAQTFQAEDDDEDEDAEDEDDSDEEITAREKARKITQSKPTAAPAAKKELPTQALADPIKTVTKLLDRLQKTQQGLQQLLDYYQLPPLVTAGSDTTTRFLVDVARKRGRLGRGGIPNLNAAALTVLSDVNDDRLKLPALSQQPSTTSRAAAANKGQVQIVTQLAEPFRLEGLFGDSVKKDVRQGAGAMDIET